MRRTLFLSCLFLFAQNSLALDCSEGIAANSIHLVQCYFQCKDKVECNRLKKSIQRDSHRNCLPHPRDVDHMSSELKSLEQNIKQVRGQVFYADILGGPYGYWMYSRKGHLIIQTTVHFSNFDEISEFHQNRLRRNLAEAAKIWDRNNPFDFPVKFAFQIVDDPTRAHVRNIRLVPKTRGPYFKKWNINWSVATIAHEFGHILGLDDECSYVGGSKESICESTSFMCNSNSSEAEIKPYHFYLVFRRLYCA